MSTRCKTIETITINNINFHYKIIGKGHTEIVLISGYTGDISLWQPIAEHLANNPKYKILIFSPQGSGHTLDDNKPLTVESMATNIYHLYQALKFNKPIIGGFALGACIGLRIAKDYPESISGLILVSGTLHFSEQAQQWCEILAKNRETGTEAAFRDSAKLLYKHGFSKAFQKTNLETNFVNMLSMELVDTQSPKGQRRQVEALKKYDARDWAHEIHCLHALIISPDEDQFSPPEDCQQLSSAINGQLKIIKDAGHAVLIEKPDAVALHMDEFISKC